MHGSSGRFTPSPRRDLPEATNPSYGPASPENAGSVRSRLVRAGLAYPGVAEEEGFSEVVYLCGLRQNAQDRSNVAFQNMGAEEEGAITVRTTVYSGESTDTNARVLEDVTLEPGGFHQYSGLLGVLESVGGNRQGYVKVERVGRESALLRLRGDQRPGELGRVVHLSGDGEFAGGEHRSDVAGDCGDERVHQRADGDELLGGAQEAGFRVCGRGDRGGRQDGRLQHEA